MLLYKELHNIEIPDVISPDFLSAIHDLVAVEKLKWTPCDIKPGAVLIFNIKGYGAHVGYVIDEDRMIHTWEKTNGVTIERISFSWKNRILGAYEYGKEDS